MTIQQMKDAIVVVYDTASWKKKVANMYDDQVIAIYHNFLDRGILDKVMRKEKPKVNKIIEVQATYVEPESQQMTIFDFMN